MATTVGVDELQQSLGSYLRRVERGERFVVTDHDRPVALLGPAPSSAELDRLIATDRVSPPSAVRLPEPLHLDADPYVLTKALGDIRGEP